MLAGIRNHMDDGYYRRMVRHVCRDGETDERPRFQVKFPDSQ